MTERRVILLVAAIFCFGYSFHQLWLLYDVVCVGCAVHVLGPRVEASVRRLAGWYVVLVVAWCLASASLHGTSTLWALAIWDTLKHGFLWLYLLRGWYGTRSGEPSAVLGEAFYRFCGVAFVANAAFAAYQYVSGEVADNIDGFFGPYATHSLGYFMILYFVLAYRRGERGLRLAAILAVAAGVALIGESMGFFILLPLWFAAVNVQGKRAGSLAAGALLLVVLAIVLARTQPAFVDSMISRATNVIAPSEPPSPDQPINGRGTAIAYASLVGGWTGDGPGTYSIIYGMEGPGAWLLDVVQIDICELGHLLAEWGGLGVGVVLGLFGMLHAALRISVTRRLVLFALFALLLVHGQLLMDERLIFFEMLTVLALLGDAAPPPQRDQDPRGAEREARREPGSDDLAAARA
jgi:hypothetical protein